MNCRFARGDARYIVRLERLADGRYRATIGARTYVVEARLLADGGWLLEIDGARTLAYTAAQGNRRYVSVGGENYALTPAETRAKRRPTAGAAGGSLTAQMPGQVMDVPVRAGDVVTGGQTLVVLEAMKMEIRVTAPGEGRVARVLVSVGEVVERGQALVEMEAET